MDKLLFGFTETEQRSDEMGSSIGQSILMAITVTVNKYASSSVQSVQYKHQPTKDRFISSESRRDNGGSGRRALVLAALIAQVSDSKSQLLGKYLKKSEENKAKNDKERLESYYKRNYKDYFEFVEGSLEGKSEEQLTESEKGIRDWLKANRK